MSKRFKLGDLVLPDCLRGGGPGQWAGDAPGTIIGKKPAEYPDKWHRVEYTVLWSSTGVICDDVWSEELMHYRGER